MLLNKTWLLVCYTLEMYMIETSECLFLIPVTDSTGESQNSKENEIHNITSGLKDEHSSIHEEEITGLKEEQPSVSSVYNNGTQNYKPNEESPFPYDYEDYEDEENIAFPYDYEDYEDQENIATDDSFEEEWNNDSIMEISFIGKFDPSFLNDDRIRKRKELGNSRRYKRAPRKPFNKTIGCNKLPLAPGNSGGECHHRYTIAKCLVKCHRFNRYPDNSKEKMFLCHHGYWKPQKLPDCVTEIPPVPCEDIYISGKNMTVTCIEDSGMINCIAECDSGFTFRDKEIAKIIKCEKINSVVSISHTKFPDCYSN